MACFLSVQVCKYTDFRLYVNLEAAEKYTNQTNASLQAAVADIVMTYRYDSSGNRTIREKSDITAGADEIYQDVYLGAVERRHVQLQDSQGDVVSIHMVSQQSGGAYHFADVSETRKINSSSGLRIQWKVPKDGTEFEGTPQIFLNLGDHLGSTSAVIDYDTGELVEFSTYYAYGAEESVWQNTDAKYDNGVLHKSISTIQARELQRCHWIHATRRYPKLDDCRDDRRAAKTRKAPVCKLYRH